MKTFLKYLMRSVLVLAIALAILGEFLLHVNERKTLATLRELSVTNARGIILLEKALDQKEAFILAKQGIDYSVIAKDLETIHNDLAVMNILHPSPAWEDAHFIQTTKKLVSISRATDKLKTDTKTLKEQHVSILNAVAKKEEPTIRKCRPVEMEGSICRP